MEWLLLIVAIAVAGAISARLLAGRSSTARVAIEYGPLVDRGRIEGFTIVLLRTGQTVSAHSGDSVLQVHERAVLLGPSVYRFADLRRVNAAGSEFEANQADGLVRVSIQYPRQASRINEALVRVARAQGVRIGAPQGRDPFPDK